MKTKLLVSIVAIVGVTAVLGAASNGTTSSDSDAREKLLRERTSVLAERLEAAIELSRNGDGKVLYVIMETRSQYLNSVLEMDLEKPELIKQLLKILRDAKETERICKLRVDNRDLVKDAFLCATARRLDAEIALLDAQE